MCCWERRGGGDGHPARLAHHGNVVGREAQPAAYRIDGHRPDELEVVQRRAALHPAREAVERDLGDYRSDARIFGGDDDDVPAAERGAPQRDPLWIHAFEAASAANDRAPVLELALDTDQLARLATALAKAAVVERECREAGLGEPPRVVEQPVLGAAEAVAHHNAWPPSGRMARVMEVAHELHAIRLERHLGTLDLLVTMLLRHRYLLSARQTADSPTDL